MRALRAAVCAALTLTPGIAGAQTVGLPPDPSTVRVRLGPALINPTLALTNLGVDTNVFNSPSDPKRDFTLTVTPQANIWLRMGRTWVASSVRQDVVWYHTYASERSTGYRYSVGWLVPLSLISFDVGTDLVHTRARPGFEIDERSERSEIGYNGGLEVRALSRTLVGVRADRRDTDFAADASFQERSLREQLKRTATTGALTVRHEVTPLTSVTFEVGRQWERFEFTPARDTESTTMRAGLRFDPSALISGSAQVGFRHFEPLTADVEEFRGTTAAVNLAYVALGATRVGVQVDRDIQHSFRIEQPYYLQTSMAGSLAQQIYGPLDVEARISRSRLEYRQRATLDAPQVDRVDRIRGYGVGVGYHLGTDLRVAFNLDQQQRDSDVPDTSYEGLRFGISVTYGR